MPHIAIMSLFTIFGIAVALAMDAFAVAIAVGVSLHYVGPRQLFRLSYHFGLFQALMPVIGWWSGTAIRSFVENYAHWIAFGLLAAVGTNMIREAFQLDEEEENSTKDATRGISLVVLSIATSIDALAVGFTISMLNISIVTPAIIIGVVAALLTLIGMQLGKKVTTFKHLSLYAELLGGTVLWIIGIKILYQNGIFNFLFS